MNFEFFCCGEWIQVTAQYSNAVLVAVLPHITEFARNLDLPVTTPITAAHVQRFTAEPHRDWIGGGVVLTNGMIFGFDNGHVSSFETRRCFWSLQDPREISRFYGSPRMTQREAVHFVREAIRKVGYSLEDTVTDMEPHVEQAEGIGTNIVPHFQITWRDPRGGTATLAEVDARGKTIERLRFQSRVTLYRPAPKVDVEPGELPRGHPWRALNEMGKVNPEYARRLVPFVFSAIEDWARKMEWNLPLPVKTNHVKTFYVSDQGGWPHCEVIFANGWQFTFRNHALTSAGSPRRFFDSDKLPFRVTNYVGRWKLGEHEAIELGRRTVAKLGHPPVFVHTEIQPRVFRPYETKGMPPIPRLEIEWNYPDLDHRQQWIKVEVDCDRGSVEAVHFDDASLWGQPPPIDVPISLRTAAVGKTSSNNSASNAPSSLPR